MAILFMDGFDKYGGANSNTASTNALLQQEWTTAAVATIVAPLSALGQAVNFGSAGAATKTLLTNYGRIIGGFRFSSPLTAAAGVQFNDGGSNQCGIAIATTGVIQLRNGAFSTGTLINSGGAISASSTHYLEWDITLGNSAAYQVWLDGVSLFSGTGDTTATANNTISSVILVCAGSATMTVDDLYVFDSTGTTNNAPLLTSPRIETTFPTADSAVQFAFGAATLGNSVSRTSGAATGAVNQLRLHPFTPSRNMTLTAIGLLPAATSGTANFRPVVYADNAGSPTGGALLSAGSTVIGVTSGVILIMPLTTPQSLTAGTQYWLGHMTDTNVNQANLDGGANDRTVTSTFSSGAPGTGPGAFASNASTCIFGVVTLASPVNFYEVNQQPTQGLQSYVVDATATHEDLYSFGSLSTTPTNIYAVGVKANVARSDTGAKTVSMRTKSSATDSGGSLTGQTAAPATFGWLGSYFETDPNGSIAWTAANLNAATSGVRIDS